MTGGMENIFRKMCGNLENINNQLVVKIPLKKRQIRCNCLHKERWVCCHAARRLLFHETGVNVNGLCHPAKCGAAHQKKNVCAA
jgi:hypothetical protein